MPRPRTTADLSQVDVSPHKRLIAAMLQLAVSDARLDNSHSDAARAWLRNEPLVRWWIDLAGFPDEMYPRLIQASGMEA